MKPLLALLAIVAALVGTSARAGSNHAPWLVTLEGVGGVRPGLSESEVGRRLGVTLRTERFGRCTMAFFGSGVPAKYAIFWRGRLGSVWFEGEARTGRGIRIGSTRAELRRAYPQRSERKDFYVPTAQNVFVRRSDGPPWRLRFDVSPRGRVTRIAFGNWTVFLTEGCA